MKNDFTYTSCAIKQTLKLLKIVHSFEWNKEIGEHVLVSKGLRSIFHELCERFIEY